MRRCFVVLAVLVATISLPACKRAVPTAESLEGAPHLALRGEVVFVDGTPAGSVRPMLESGRLFRVDELSTKLEGLRDGWKAKHPGAAFPGEYVLELERGEKLVAVKSVFQTAAFAGYRHATLVGDTDAASRWMGHVEAQAPGGPTTPVAPQGSTADSPSAARPAPTPASLAATVRPGGIALSWGKGGSVPPDEQVVASAAALRDAVAAMAARDAAHTSPSDPGLDEVVLSVPNDAEVAALAQVLDALDGVRRDIDGPDGKRRSMPAFTVTLSVCPGGCAENPEGTFASRPTAIEPPRPFEGLGSIGGSRLGGPTRSVLRKGDVSVNGHLPPEVVERIVRQQLGRFRLCYENGLATNPALSGDVTTKFVINREGEVSAVSDGGSTLPDHAAVACIQAAFKNISFPQPEAGTVTVVYPMHFEPAPRPAP